MKKVLVNSAKIAISLLILGLLAYKGWTSVRNDPAAFEKLVNEPKNWPLMGAALGVCLTAVLLTFVRWRLLVQALGMTFPLRDALRLGFVGYLFNFTLSLVGGDLIKAVAIAHRNPGRKTAAAATVVVDRIVGLYALFIVGAVASLCMDFSSLRVEDAAQVLAAQRVCQSIQVLTIIGTLGLALLLLPGLATSPLWEMLGQIPKVGPALISLLDAVRMYRRQPLLLGVSIAMSIGAHCMYAIAIYLIALALPGDDPSLAANFIVAPVSMAATAAPLPGGIGAFEATFAFMYQALAPNGVLPVQGLVIAAAYRAITLVIALIGVVYYIADRREVKELMNEAQEEPAVKAA